MTDPAPPYSETILLVDDEPAVRELIRVVLKMNGYRVFEAAGGEEALRLLDSFSEPIHLILTDVQMPGMTGRELTERAQQRAPNIKVLLISGFINAADFHEWAVPTGVVFLPKPFNVEDLERTVRETLNGYCPLYRPCEPPPHEAALSWTIP
ncbi:MAG: response regulator [Nitrospirae bacterium]|nr:MAG: response regulator [Nitrospirota bacterium]